jgi:hypothetical protein
MLPPLYSRHTYSGAVQGYSGHGELVQQAGGQEGCHGRICRRQVGQVQ